MDDLLGNFVTPVARGRIGAGLLGVTIEEGEPLSQLTEKRLVEIERRILAIEEMLSRESV